MLKVAHYAAQLEDYEKAIQIYEQVCAQIDFLPFHSQIFPLISHNFSLYDTLIIFPLMIH